MSQHFTGMTLTWCLKLCNIYNACRACIIAGPTYIITYQLAPDLPFRV